MTVLTLATRGQLSAVEPHLLAPRPLQGVCSSAGSLTQHLQRGLMVTLSAGLHWTRKREREREREREAGCVRVDESQACFPLGVGR